MLTFSWAKVGTPTKVILAGQGLALMYAMYKKSHVTSVVTGMTILGTVLAEWQSQKATAVAGPPKLATVSDMADFRKLADDSAPEPSVA